MTDTTVKWQDKCRVWQDFDVADLEQQSRNHATKLFCNKTIPVIAKHGNQYIVNTEELLQQYRQAGKKCMLFSELPASEEKFGQVGFAGVANGK